ncbi:flagellar basal body L-ring protein FlgH [Rubrivirga sp. IMCC43871]|uniref:flagellar basal body L-ring protein FlgH n=1 Tax=Rubrivirga sp. IMCC43871 TaxID=3391575 RepID=UPI0039900556
MHRLFALLLLTAAPALAQADAPAEPAPTRIVSMFSAIRAHQPGDLLTVILEERTSARRQSANSASASADVSGGGSASTGGAFGLDAGVGGRRDADSRTVQSDLLTGTLTARVVEVDAAGNLTIEGERRLNVDGDVHLMTVRGVVRAADVGPSNTVLSTQIANADVVYAQEGGGPKFLKGRFLTLVGTVAVIVGVVALGMMSGGGGDVVADIAPPAE